MRFREISSRKYPSPAKWAVPYVLSSHNRKKHGGILHLAVLHCRRLGHLFFQRKTVESHLAVLISGLPSAVDICKEFPIGTPKKVAARTIDLQYLNLSNADLWET